MPDFGLTEGLMAALKAAGKTPVMRPAEEALARRAAGTAPPAATPVVPGTPAAPARPVAVMPTPRAVEAPPVDPSTPGGDMTPKQAVDPAASQPTATPAPADVAASATAGAPPEPALAAPEPSVRPSGIAPAPGEISPSNLAPPEPPPAIRPSLNGTMEEANRFVHANLGEFSPTDLNMTHMPNVDTMMVPNRMKAAILQVAEDNKPAIEAARRGTITDEQMIGMAQDLAMNTDMVRQVLTREFGEAAQRPEVALAARMVEQHQMGQLYDLAASVADGTATSEQLIKYTQQKQLVSDYVTQMAGIRAEAGRGTRVFGIPVGLPSEVTDHIADLLKRTDMSTQDMAKAIRLAQTPAGIANIVSGMQNVGLVKGSALYLRGLVQRVFVNGLLSGAAFAKIFVGNTVNIIKHTADLYVAGIGREMVGLAARIGGFPTADEGVRLMDAFAYTHGLISGGADALRVAGRVMRTGIQLDNVTRTGEVRISGAQNLAQVFPGIQGTYFGQIAHVLDEIVDAPGKRLIGGEDEFGKTLGYRAYVTMMSLKEVNAKIINGSLRPGDEAAEMTRLMNNMSPEMKQAAEAWAHRQTFQSELGPIGKAGMNFLNKLPALRFIIPFMRTATNIFKQGVGESTLLAAFSAKMRNAILNGGFEGDLAKARLATGTAIGSMAAWMAIHDRITGGMPKDPKERAVWAAEGRAPYSFRVGNVWYSYAWHEPMATTVGLVADAIKVGSYIHANDDAESLKSQDAKVQDAIGHIMASVVENTGNKTFLSGAASFSEMYNDPEHFAMTWARQMGANMVPFSGALKMARNFQDPYLRHADSLLEAVRNELPTVMGSKGSQDLPARHDIFGQPRLTASGNSILGPLSPFQSHPDTRDDVSEEIARLMEQQQKVPVSMPSQLVHIDGTGKGIAGGGGMRLNADEYEEYVRMARGDKIFDGGKYTFREKLGQVMASGVYKTAKSDAERVVMIESIAHQADQIGLVRLNKDNLDFRDRMSAWNQQKNRIQAGK